MGLYLPMAARGLDAGMFLGELSAEVRAAEAVGLDLVLVPEHHVGPPESLGDPTSLTAWLLAQTSSIRVGPGVLLMPLYHPAHVAEWGSFLQHASGGRLVLGVGTGYQEDDFRLFGMERSTRVEDFAQGLVGLRSSWRGDGQPRVIPNLALEDEPPIWIGAWSYDGLERAAKDADAWLVDPMRRVDEVAKMAEVYRSACEEARKQPQIAVIRELWVDESDEAAHRNYLPAVTPIIEYYRRNGALRGQTAPIDDLVAERIVCGSVETVVNQLVDIVLATGATTVLGTLRHPSGPAHGDVLRSIELLGAEVLPGVRKALGGAELRSA